MGAMRLPEIADEAVFLLGGARAILLQLAHPSVGAGVARHSDFANDPVKRLRNTLTYLYVVAYGTDAERDAVRRLVDRAHGPVRGDGYSAFDPDAQLWVAATLYDSGLDVYERVLGPLPADEAEELYRDFAALGTTLQVPEGVWPADRAAFRAYWGAMPLTVTDEARRVSRDLLFPNRPAWVRMLMPPVRLVTAGLLSPELRRAYGVRWTPQQERRFERLLAVVRWLYPRLPRVLRTWPTRHYLGRFRKHLANGR